MTILTILAIIFCSTFALGLLSIPHIVKLAKDLRLYDIPDKRKVHQLPIPRLGGVAFLPISFVCCCIVMLILARLGYDIEQHFGNMAMQNILAFVCGGILLFTVGLYDDIRGASYKIKFVFQILAACILCLGGLWIANLGHVFFIDEIPFWLGMPLTVLVVVYVTNAMNLIDGIDGLSSGLSAIALVVIAGLLVITEDYAWAIIAAAFLGVVLAFFRYNVFSKKNKLFMGDAGSLTLGYTLSYLILHFWQRNPIWNEHIHSIGIIAASTLIIPLFDVVRVMMSRLRDGRSPFLPDKNHIHHKLLRTGLSGRMTMVTLLFLSGLFIVGNFLVADYISQTLVVVLDIVLFALMHYIINYFIYRKEDKTGRKWSRTLML